MVVVGAEIYRLVALTKKKNGSNRYGWRPFGDFSGEGKVTYILTE